MLNAAGQGSSVVLGKLTSFQLSGLQEPQQRAQFEAACSGPRELVVVRPAAMQLHELLAAREGVQVTPPPLTAEAMRTLQTAWSVSIVAASDAHVSSQVGLRHCTR
jgi:hypothetical protein